MVEDGHVGELGEVEVVVGGRSVIAVVEGKGSVMEDVGGVYGIVDVELAPLDGLNDERTGDWVDGVRHLPDVVIAFLSLLDVDGHPVLVLVDHLVVAQEVLLTRVLDECEGKRVGCEAKQQA